MGGEGYTTREVSRLLGLPASRIRGWVRRGLVAPARGLDSVRRFSFQDVTVLRHVLELLKADVPTRRVHEALDAIRDTLPAGQPLSGVAVSAMGHRVLVRDELSVWEPSSGQLELDFEVDATPEPENEASALRLPTSRSLTPDVAPPAVHDERHEGGADTWYDAAVDLEAEHPDEAIAAYRTAIELEPSHAEAHLNLGRILHEAASFAEAEDHYRRALAADPLNARATYNLGVVLEDRHQPADARIAYERAVALDPDLAAAHFNLSRLLEGEGRGADALGHLMRYRQLTERDAPRG
jgi:tetratricopeptide (TPR) repeat protein